MLQNFEGDTMVTHDLPLVACEELLLHMDWRGGQNATETGIHPVFLVMFCYSLHNGYIDYFLIRIKDLIGFNFGSWVPNNPYKSGQICKNMYTSQDGLHILQKPLRVSPNWARFGEFC